ncbi:hypothetical protein MM221_16405 [Salipaludibacillus sp. LMS25]|jgi:hypothetical protein|uniref:hypothetical protein n=1 Tax=Salipaludibacillus sp. LMS25 TaxID=2924031 RepID=UPI0020D10C2E|nr:hypothetical protein [Salipaludibacillus sp. LMS25]UTR14140.1 hypothetical protein MM221_16405 [Salipaludibacillus sp. LMS25]
MKKFLIVIVIAAGLMYGGYRYALSFISDQVFDKMTSQVLTEEVVEELSANPQLVTAFKSYASKAKRSTDTSLEELPFTTKEEATKTVLSKFSVGEVKDMATQVTKGMTSAEQAEIEQKVLTRLSEKEIEALLIIGLEEMDELPSQWN